jgi:hypothetical protein
MDIDDFEGDVTSEFHTRHDHAGNPKVKDVASRNHQIGRVELAKFRRIVGPTQDSVRPDG